MMTTIINSHHKRLTAVGVMLVFLITTAAALAQGGAALIDPASKLYFANPGESLSGSVSISNPAQTALRLRLSLSDWKLDLAGQFTFSDSGTLERSASGWVTFTTTSLDLAPNENHALSYTVNVPADSEPGTYWTVLFAEGEPSEPEPGQSSATVSVRVGHVIYVNVPELISEGAVVGIFGDPPSAPERPYMIMAQYANTGNVAQGVEGAFVVRNDQGETVIDAVIERSVVLPGSDRVFQINVVGPLPAGNYTALVVLNYGDEDRDVAGTHDFVLEQPLAEPGTQEQ